jgi:hypothetical protein
MDRLVKRTASLGKAGKESRPEHMAEAKGINPQITPEVTEVTEEIKEIKEAPPRWSRSLLPRRDRR